jgi:predicted kinase
MKMPTLIIMAGLPRSGKTTRALSMGHPIVSPDAVRLALHGEQCVPHAERMVWCMAHYMVRALFEAGHDHVILDACNVSAARRDEWQQGPYSTTLEIVRTSPAVCRERADRDNMGDVLGPVIQRMARAWDLGEFDE